MDGDIKVDPDKINNSGIRIDFDEPITGSIELTDEAGTDLKWIGVVAHQTAVLVPPSGRELVHGTVYIIHINVEDVNHNIHESEIWFTTDLPSKPEPAIPGLQR